MSEPFLGEIRIVGFDYAPRGWAFCDGQLLPINQNQSLYALLGTTYGGDGRTSFALPDLRGRVPIHRGPGHPMGTKGGEETTALALNEMPPHTVQASADESAANDPTSARGARSGQIYDNMQPFLALSFIIALEGIYPSRG